jgi:hypothetical protein
MPAEVVISAMCGMNAARLVVPLLGSSAGALAQNRSSVFPVPTVAG